MKSIPLLLLTDSYKLCHFKAYPKSEKLIAYGEFRTSYQKDTKDSRIVYYGIQYILDHYLNKPITQEDLDELEFFCNTHNVGYSKFPFPKDLFKKVIAEYGGWFPIKLESLEEGEVVYPHIPVYQITASGEFAGLVTYLESLLTMVWYPCTVATLSRRGKDSIEKAFENSVDPKNYFLIESRLHDFGFRGCTSIEQSIIGGSAHLLNFTGSDTIPAAYYIQSQLNNGKPIATSIPASEHSVMTSYPTEREALVKMIEEFGSSIVACVMDSYDYVEALEKILPTVSALVLEKGGMLVIRPDSGDSVETVLQGLRAAEKVFGATKNSKGYKVINHCNIIQGDGIDLHILEKLLGKVLENGYSAENVAFGMGGGLLQKVNRDTMSFATKLSRVIDESGEVREVMKYPKTDGAKISLPGEFEVRLNAEDKTPLVFPKTSTSPSESNLLKVVYDNGPIERTKPSFQEIKNKLEERWHKLPTHHNPLTNEMEAKKNEWLNSFNKSERQI